MKYDINTIKPSNMNIELTTCCPLRCPQCYCSLTGGRHIDFDRAVYWIRQGIQMGVRQVELSGGETMCYPRLTELVKMISGAGAIPNIAVSGYNFTQTAYDRLKAAGIGGIFVSLNGSTEEINRKSRDGYDYAVEALKLLQKNHHTETNINWVMHNNNTDDFPQMIRLAENYGVSKLIILGLKPTSDGSLETYPDYEQMKYVSGIIKAHRGSTKIMVESCYSQLLAIASETKLFGNLNVGINKGCGAGLTTFSVNVDGLLSPCRHLEVFEQYETLNQYWLGSETLNKLRNIDGEPASGKCEKCHFRDHCRPCNAANGREGLFRRGNNWCSVTEPDS